MKTVQTYKMSALVLAVSAASIWGHCSDDEGLVDENYRGEPLVTVNGALSIEAPPGGEKVSIAVAWMNDIYEDPSPPETDEIGLDDTRQCQASAPSRHEVYRAPGTPVWALQAVSYDAVSLLNFSLPIMDLPPESSRMDLADLYLGEGWIAYGMLIAFIDKNENGVFDAATPDTEGDRLLAASYKQTEERIYEGVIVYLNGTIDADSAYGSLLDGAKQGYNVIVYEFDPATGEEAVAHGMDRTLELFTLVPNTVADLTEMQCSELEYDVHFNESFSPDDYDVQPICFVEYSETGFVDEEGNLQINASDLKVKWSAAIADPDNPCVVHELTGEVCFPDGALPEDWPGICAEDVDAIISGVEHGSLDENAP